MPLLTELVHLVGLGTTNMSLLRSYQMPFLLRPEQFDEWLGAQWETVLANPDKSPLGNVIKQPELF